MGVPVFSSTSVPRCWNLSTHQIIGALQQQMTDIGVTLYHEKRWSQSGRRLWTGHGLAEAPATITTRRSCMRSAASAATKDLNLEAIGITPDARGRMIVNDHFQTSVPHIYAAGDVIGFPALASTSMQQGRHAACHAFAIPTTQTRISCPTASIPFAEISMVGRNEEDLGQGRDSLCGRHCATIGKSPRTAHRDDTGTVKLLFHRLTHALLGVHAIGEGATELIHIGQAVMAYGERSITSSTRSSTTRPWRNVIKSPRSTGSIVYRDPGHTDAGS